MNSYKLLIALSLISIICNHCYADNRGYLKMIFANKDAVPTYQVTTARSQQTASRYQLNFTDSNLNKVFSNYTVLDFEKEYPIADSFPDDQTPAVRLRLVYRVVIDTTTGKSYDGLKKSLDSIGSSLINTTARQLPSKNLSIPNDYNLPNLQAQYPTVAQQLDLVNAQGAWNTTTGLSCIKIGISEPPASFQLHNDLNGKVIVSSRSITPLLLILSIAAVTHMIVIMEPL